jgi:hypothetical protein
LNVIADLLSRLASADMQVEGNENKQVCVARTKENEKTTYLNKDMLHKTLAT